MVVDEVAKMTSSEEESTRTQLDMEVQKRPSIEEVPTFVIQKVRKRAAKFTILNDTLYKKGFSMPYLKCVDEEEAKYILEEIQKEICGAHVSPRSLVSKVIRTGYFWPTMQVDAMELIKKCDNCQRFGSVQRLLAEKLTTIASLWPFAQ